LSELSGLADWDTADGGGANSASRGQRESLAGPGWEAAKLENEAAVAAGEGGGIVGGFGGGEAPVLAENDLGSVRRTVRLRRWEELEPGDGGGSGGEGQ
jgi:hypothetical protein